MQKFFLECWKGNIKARGGVIFVGNIIIKKRKDINGNCLLV